MGWTMRATMANNALNERLREAIRNSGRSQTSIAAEAGMRRTNLTTFLGGKVGMSFAAGVKLANVVGMPLDRDGGDDE